MVQIVNEIKQIKSWEEYISEGLEARESVDNSNWLLGDLASGIEKDYGEDSIGKYSYAIGVVKKTLMGYRTVAKAFPQEVREKHRKLSFSHFKSVVALPQPEAWLEKANDNDWSVEILNSKIKDAYGDIRDIGIEEKPPKVYRCKECGKWRLENIAAFDICRGHYVFEKGVMTLK